MRNVDSTPDDEGDDVDVGRRTVRYRRSRRVAPMDDGLRTTSMAGGGSSWGGVGTFKPAKTNEPAWLAEVVPVGGWRSSRRKFELRRSFNVVLTLTVVTTIRTRGLIGSKDYVIMMVPVRC